MQTSRYTAHLSRRPAKSNFKTSAQTQFFQHYQNLIKVHSFQLHTVSAVSKIKITKIKTQEFNVQPKCIFSKRLIMNHILKDGGGVELLLYAIVFSTPGGCNLSVSPSAVFLPHNSSSCPGWVACRREKLSDPVENQWSIPLPRSSCISLEYLNKIFSHTQPQLNCR